MPAARELLARAVETVIPLLAQGAAKAVADAAAAIDGRAEEGGSGSGGGSGALVPAAAAAQPLARFVAHRTDASLFDVGALLAPTDSVEIVAQSETAAIPPSGAVPRTAAGAREAPPRPAPPRTTSSAPARRGFDPIAAVAGRPASGGGAVSAGAKRARRNVAAEPEPEPEPEEEDEGSSDDSADGTGSSDESGDWDSDEEEEEEEEEEEPPRPSKGGCALM
jgi:hypothetical protein